MVSLQLTRMLSAEHSAARQQGSKTAGLHGSAAARQHNIDSRYKIAAINQNDCPSGWSNLIDAEACRVAALALGKIAHPNDAVFINRDNQHRPNGCFLWFSGSVHFNTLTDSAPTGPTRGTAICEVPMSLALARLRSFPPKGCSEAIRHSPKAFHHAAHLLGLKRSDALPLYDKPYCRHMHSIVTTNGSHALYHPVLKSMHSEAMRRLGNATAWLQHERRSCLEDERPEELLRIVDALPSRFTVARAQSQWGI